MSETQDLGNSIERLLKTPIGRFTVLWVSNCKCKNFSKCTCLNVEKMPQAKPRRKTPAKILARIRKETREEKEAWQAEIDAVRKPPKEKLPVKRSLR